MRRLNNKSRGASIPLPKGVQVLDKHKKSRAKTSKRNGAAALLLA
ncbi:hypothetical protein GCWU000325_00767 [Alloprevotella tannerae ATCC 51259]|uniref:Uncharacterized protein n=1 Tax=Alloprevotella tannerae ATCC 51259 TaxID=626522 RepID=C9LEY6_9BACT|nr:hypothetical protein GCWU000325_00767 [Alloprevotella tannerae ATCC 51259]